MKHWRPAGVIDAAKYVLALLGICYQLKAGGVFLVFLAPCHPPLHLSVVTCQHLSGHWRVGRSLGLEADSLRLAFVGQNPAGSKEVRFLLSLYFECLVSTRRSL